ncbi:MAG: hypothetical protein IRZ03_14425 [Acidobacterium ailaaui]|nr:hypothetical protein [Pseudacidobacterium ailaaui]
MKKLYEKLLSLLQSISALKYIDLDKGQIDYFELRPAVAFPAALVSIDFANCEDETDTTQRVQAQILIRLAFDYTGETSAATQATLRDQALDFYELIDQIYAAIQGYSDEEIDHVSRTAVRMENRQDQLRVAQIYFNAWLEQFA